MKKSQGHQNRRTATKQAQQKIAPAVPSDQDALLANLLENRGFDLKGKNPTVMEMLAFQVGYNDAMGGWSFEEALAKLVCLADLIAENPRMAQIRNAILAMADADRSLADAMSALREI